MDDYMYLDSTFDPTINTVSLSSSSGTYITTDGLYTHTYNPSISSSWRFDKDKFDSPWEKIGVLASGQEIKVEELGGLTMGGTERKCFAVKCMGREDLSPERILKSMSKLKGKMMIDCTPYKLKKIECSMTPAVKQSLLSAGRRLRMYGRKTPYIAKFDEYGNRLPDEIQLDEDAEGMTLKIVKPSLYGEYYLELRGYTYLT